MAETNYWIGRMVKGCGLAVTCVLMIGCARFEESGFPGSASSMARNQMMVVRQEPATFGYYRLTSLARIYPDLEFFVGKRGVPDFLAETDSENQDYFILYYLKKREAFACRTHLGRQHSIEFAGPYPITKREFETLDGFRKKTVR
jgi:hypothetical protein